MTAHPDPYAFLPALHDKPMGSPWSKPELAQLVALYLAEHSVEDIAAVMKRPVKAVINRVREAKKEGILPYDRDRKPPPPAPVHAADLLGRPQGVPFRTRSGLWAICLASGTVPYVPSVHADAYPLPGSAA